MNLLLQAQGIGAMMRQVVEDLTSSQPDIRAGRSRHPFSGHAHVPHEVAKNDRHVVNDLH